MLEPLTRKIDTGHMVVCNRPRLRFRIAINTETNSSKSISPNHQPHGGVRYTPIQLKLDLKAAEINPTIPKQKDCRPRTWNP